MGFEIGLENYLLQKQPPNTTATFTADIDENIEVRIVGNPPPNPLETERKLPRVPEITTTTAQRSELKTGPENQNERIPLRLEDIQEVTDIAAQALFDNKLTKPITTAFCKWAQYTPEWKLRQDHREDKEARYKKLSEKIDRHRVPRFTEEQLDQINALLNEYGVSYSSESMPPECEKRLKEMEDTFDKSPNGQKYQAYIKKSLSLIKIRLDPNQDFSDDFDTTPGTPSHSKQSYIAVSNHKAQDWIGSSLMHALNRIDQLFDSSGPNIQK